MHNVEKSAFRKGEYVGYGAGAVWHIRRVGAGLWRAHPVESALNTITATTLRGVSGKLHLLDIKTRAIA